jgi:hypothetical protein
MIAIDRDASLDGLFKEKNEKEYGGGRSFLL